MDPSFKLYAEIDISQDGIQFYLTNRDEQDRKYIVNLNGDIQLLDGIQRPTPTFFLSTENSQQLIDSLYRMGMRSTETTSTLESMKSHIHDLQEMVAHLLRQLAPKMTGTEPGKDPYRLLQSEMMTHKQVREFLSITP